MSEKLYQQAQDFPFPCVLGEDKDFQDREDSTGRAVYAMEGIVQGMYCESMVSRVGFQESVRKEKTKKRS